MIQLAADSGQVQRGYGIEPIYFEGKYPVNDKIIWFKKTYSLTVRKEDNYFVSESHVFKTSNIGKTKEELIADFLEDLYLAWMIYVDCSKDELTEQAKDLRNSLQKWLVVEEVQGQKD